MAVMVMMMIMMIIDGILAFTSSSYSFVMPLFLLRPSFFLLLLTAKRVVCAA